MAYGMRPQELAAVGRNVNQQGVGVDESSIQSAMDAELDEERADTVARNKSRKNKARIANEKTKAGVRQKAMKAIKVAAVEGAGMYAKSVANKPEPGVEMAELTVSDAPDNLSAETAAPRLKLASSDPRGRPAIGTEAHAKQATQQQKLIKGLGRYRKKGLGPETDPELLALTEPQAYSKPGELYGDNDPELDKLTRTLAKERSLKNGS